MRDLKPAIQNGEILLGTWLNTDSPQQAEIIGYAGFDFVLLDTEHSSYDIEASENLVRAAAAARIPAFVRVSQNTPAAIGKVLDFGAQGVMIPHVSSADAAQAAVRGAHYAPDGVRGAAPNVRAAQYGRVPWEEYLPRAQAQTIVMLQIEGQEGIDNLDTIMAVDGVDVLFVGPFDLSESLGISGQLEHPLLVETISDIVQRARAQGIALGIWMPRANQVGRWIDTGVQIITVANSEMIFLDGCRTLVETVRAHVSA